MADQKQIPELLARMQTDTLSLPVEGDLLDTVSRQYVIEDREAVGDFLAAHPFLIPLLTAIREQALVYFPGSAIFLEVFADPEFGDLPKLLASINPAYPPEETIQRFGEFQRAWWIEASRHARGKLAITLEYR